MARVLTIGTLPPPRPRFSTSGEAGPDLKQGKTMPKHGPDMMSTAHWAARAFIAIAAVALMQGCAWAGNSSYPNQYELSGIQSERFSEAFV